MDLHPLGRACASSVAPVDSTSVPQGQDLDRTSPMTMEADPTSILAAQLASALWPMCLYSAVEAEASTAYVTQVAVCDEDLTLRYEASHRLCLSQLKLPDSCLQRAGPRRRRPGRMPRGTAARATGRVGVQARFHHWA